MRSNKIAFIFLLITSAVMTGHSKPAPEIPGEEITESEAAIKKSEKLVTEMAVPKLRKKKTWSAPSINDQLARDKTLIGLGYGALFIPAYTESRLEPDILVYKSGGGKLTPGNTGQRLLLEEGSYMIRLGSGSLYQKIKYLVSIKEGKTTVVKPEWSGLVVEVLNSDGDYINEEYDIYSMKTSESFGKGYGLVEERIKDIRTWILKPGFYKLTKVGEPFGSFKNYITVQLNPGELTNIELIFDDGTRDLIAGGIKDVSAKLKAGLNWRYGMRAGGNVSFNNTVINFDEKTRTVSTLFDFKLRAKFDNTKYLGINEIRTKNIFQWEKDKDPSSITDDIRLRSTWVRRINKYVGPYVSVKVNSNFFPIEQPLDNNTEIYIENSGGDTTRIVMNAPDTTVTKVKEQFPGLDVSSRDNLNTSPSFFPLEMGIGAGVNLELLTNYYFELSTQVGVGARPNFYKEQLRIKSKNSNTWIPRESEFEVGLEGSVSNRIRLGSKLTLDTDAELFFENGNPASYRIEEFTSDLRLNLTRFIELSYLFELNDKLKELGRTSPDRYEYANGILLRISINL